MINELKDRLREQGILYPYQLRHVSNEVYDTYKDKLYLINSCTTGYISLQTNAKYFDGYTQRH